MRMKNLQVPSKLFSPDGFRAFNVYWCNFSLETTSSSIYLFPSDDKSEVNVVIYLILFLVCAVVCLPLNSSIVRRYGTSRLYRLIRMAPREGKKRKEFLKEIFIANGIALLGLLFLLLSLVSFWESLKTIGP